MFDLSLNLTVGQGLSASFVLFLIGKSYYHQRKHWVNVPVVGSSGFIGSYIAGVKALSLGRFNVVVEEGFKKYRGKVFQIAERNHWHVLVTSSAHLDELRKLPEGTLDADIGADIHLKAQYTMGPTILSNPTYRAALKNFNNNLASHYVDMVDEMKLACSVYFPTKFMEVNGKPTADWVPVKVFFAVQSFMCRSSNRVFVEDLCRNPNWIELSVKYMLQSFIGAQFIAFFPTFLQPLVGNLFKMTLVRLRRKQAAKLLAPVIARRFELLEKDGKGSPNMPNDFLTHLLEIAEGEETKLVNITQCILSLNLAGILSPAPALARSLFLLAAYPEYVEPLREEAIRVISEEGWSKQSMVNLVCMDSFIKEGMRLYPGVAANVHRTITKDITLSDGTFLPKGTLISATAPHIMRDKNNFGEDADKFDGFRFSNRRIHQGQENGSQIVQLSSDFLTFGMGRRACPGRFLAAAELKAMLSYILLNYDFKFPDGLYQRGEIPSEMWIGTVSAVDTKAVMLFRKRESPI